GRALDAGMRSAAALAGRRNQAGSPGGETVRDCDWGSRRNVQRLLGARRVAHARPCCRCACRGRASHHPVSARVRADGDLGRAGHGAEHGGIRAAVLAVGHRAPLGSMRAVCALLIFLWAQAAVGQTQLQRADAAYYAGDRELARTLYQSVLASDPNNSRAVFQLARLLKPNSIEAIALLQRYVKLEPSDAWGYMALGDALAASGEVNEAVTQYAIARA